MVNDPATISLARKRERLNVKTKSRQVSADLGDFNQDRLGEGRPVLIEVPLSRRV
jgi:hypothetical protein